MAGRYKRPATPAEQARRDQAQAEKLLALHDRLAEQVQALRTGPDWQAALTAAARFSTYSFGNTLLIAAQRPDATAVAGYAAWQALGRQVDKGQKGIAILAPVVRRSSQPATDSDTAVAPEGPADGAERADGASEGSRTGRGSDRPVGFRVAYVWDVAQTTGEPLPETPAPQLLAGQAPDGMWAALAQVAVDRGFTITRAGTGPANGVTNVGARSVTVRPDLDDAQAVKTLAHELGHVLLHDRAVPSVDATTSAQLCRGIKEVEAESVAYLVAATHGLSTEQYTFPYITGWAASIPGSTPEQVVRDTGRRVLAAAGTLLAATQPAVEDDRAGLELAARADTARDRTAHLREQAATGPTLDPLAAADPGTPVEMLHAIHAEATRWYTAQLHAEVPDGQRAAGMLTDRGVPPTTAAAWELGYAPAGWTGLTDHLRSAGYIDPQLLDAGLGLRTARGTVVDRFRDRIMFPIRDTTGEHVVGFLGRAVRPAEGTPKYLNSPETVLYRKSKTLYGLGNAPGRHALGAGSRPVLVEGPLDAIAVTSTGAYLGVAACGTALTTEHVAALEQAAGLLDELGVTVAYDPDPAGRAASVRSYPLLRAAGAWPTAATLPTGQDPADVAARSGHPALAAALNRASRAPLVEIVIDAKLEPWTDKLQWPEGRLGALRTVAPVLAAVPPEHIGRQIGLLAGGLGLDVQIVNAEVLEALARSVSAAPTQLQPGVFHDAAAPARTEPTPRTSVQLARTGYPLRTGAVGQPMTAPVPQERPSPAVTLTGTVPYPARSLGVSSAVDLDQAQAARSVGGTDAATTGRRSL